MISTFTSKPGKFLKAAVFLTLAISGPGVAQNCTPNDIMLSSQQEIDMLQVTHGPCDHVWGNVTVEGSDIVNLDGLSSITSVDGELRIERNPSLIDLDNLSSLTSVGSLSISNNEKLTHIDGLNSLAEISEWLHIRFNEELKDINGLSNLDNVGEELFIWSTRNLTSIDGLSTLTSVGGYLSLRDNYVLANLDGLSGLTSVGSLVIWGSSYLENLNGLSGLVTIDNELNIQFNCCFTNLDALSQVKSLAGDMFIFRNYALNNLGGLSGITGVGGDLRIEGNESLAQCSSLAKLVDQTDDGEPGPGPGGSGAPDVGGDVLLADNLPGCNTTNEILAAVPLLQMNAGLNDAWFNPDTPGQGFFITVFPEIEKIFLAWFTYDTERPPEDVQAILGDPGHRWLTAFGAYVDNEAILDIELTQGGVFDLPEPIPTQSLDGIVTLDLSNCNTGTVTYEIPSVGIQGVVPIERIALDNVPLCYLLNSAAEETASRQSK